MMPQSEKKLFRDIDHTIRSLLGESEQSRARLAERLFTLISGEGHVRLGYGTQEAYFEAIGLKPRTAYQLMRTYVCCTRAGVKMSEAVVQVGMWKLNLVAPTLTQENAEKKLAEAKLHTCAQLAEARHATPLADDPPMLVRRSYAMTQEAWAVVDHALTLVQEECPEPQSPSRLLELMAADTIAGRRTSWKVSEGGHNASKAHR